METESGAFSEDSRSKSTGKGNSKSLAPQPEVACCPSESIRTAAPFILIRASDIPLVKFVRTMRRVVFGEPLEGEGVLRAFQTKLDTHGAGQVQVTPDSTAMEWDIYQISHRTSSFSNACVVEMMFNTFFLCSTPNGFKDTATGPPDTVLRPGDILFVNFFYGVPNDLATVSIFYNENPVGTTMSTAH